MLTNVSLSNNAFELSTQSLSRWHKPLSSSTNAAHGEKSYRRSRPSAAVPSDDQRGEETICFYGGLVQRSNRNTLSSLEESPLDVSPLGLLSSLPTSAGDLGKELLLSVASAVPEQAHTLVDDETSTAWMNTTTMLESCSPTPLGPPVEHAPWWSAHSDSLFPEVEEDDCVVRALVPERGRVDVERNRATTGERSLGCARKTAADACRIEFDTNTSFSGAETSVTVHDVCNKTIRSSSSSRNDSNRGCSGQFSSGARSHVASGSCIGSGTVAAASSSGATVATLGQQQQQHQSNSLKKPSDSSISDSSNSNRVGTGINSASGSRPFAAPISPTLAAAVVGTGGYAMATAPTSTLPNIDWTNETCLAGGLEFTNTIVDDPRHLWLSSPATSSSSSNITDTELERSLDEYHRAARGQSKPIETSIDCANLLDELHVELTEPPVTISPPVSLHEEIEQLSSAFDCDASNHLVSTATPTIAALPFVGLAVDDTEPIPLNIFKWLQEDISSNNVPARPELCPTTTSELVETLLVGPGAGAHFFQSGQEISTISHHTTSDSTFEQSLDQIHNINGLTSDISKPTAASMGRRIGICTTATASSTTTATTTTTHNTANYSQRDHNYYAMKRRMQEEDVVRKSAPTKMAKLLQPIGWAMDDAKFTTPSTSDHPAAATSSGDSSKQHLHAKQQAATTTTAAAVVGTMGRKLSLASRKAPTLAVNVTPRVILPAGAPLAAERQQQQHQQPSSTISGHALAKGWLQTTTMTGTTTTTTTSTTTATHEPLRMSSQAATLNTPDLTNDILDLEDEKFDLLSFIDTNDEALEYSSYHSTVEEKPTLDLLPPSPSPSPSASLTERRKTPADHSERVRTSASSSRATPGTSSSKAGDAEKQIYQLLTLDSLRQLTSDSEESRSRAATTTGGRRTNTSSACSIGSRSSASSVCGDSSSDVSSVNKAPKRRGRPPKVAGTVRDRSQYQHLSEADWRYREQRDKNNEASRKSRINRKDRELKLEMEADQLSAQHQKLAYEERRLQQDCQRWRKAVMKLALL